MAKESTSNHGEGDPEAAERFNSAEQQFVDSTRGKQKIQEGAHVRPEEQADLAKAEKAGRKRAKGEDSAVTRGEES